MQNNYSITLSNSAIERILEVKKKQNNNNKFLRIAVSGGGCSGFKYNFEMDDKKDSSDLKIYEQNSEILAITDEASLQFLNGCVVDFIKELGASYFKVVNPNASTTCGCGTSFSI